MNILFRVHCLRRVFLLIKRESEGCRLRVSNATQLSLFFFFNWLSAILASKKKKKELCRRLFVLHQVYVNDGRSLATMYIIIASKRCVWRTFAFVLFFFLKDKNTNKYEKGKKERQKKKRKEPKKTERMCGSALRLHSKRSFFFLLFCHYFFFLSFAEASCAEFH